jgi:hypothetical protein
MARNTPAERQTASKAGSCVETAVVYIRMGAGSSESPKNASVSHYKTRPTNNETLSRLFS